MKKLAIAVLLLSAACATAPTPAPAPADGQTGTTLAELQVSMTELLERIDVLNERIARVEAAQSETRAAAPAVQPRVAAPAASPVTVPQTPTPAVTASATPSAAVRGADIAGRYREAITLYAKRQYGDARAAFQAVFDADVEGDLADNALFWIGESYFAAGDFTNAMRYYRRVTTEFADQNKAPDAMLKTALSLERTGDLALAKTTLQQLIEKYPYSSSAATAKKELVRIRF